MTHFSAIDACVFDAYGTLFDVNSAARDLSARIGDKWQALSTIWRDKQLQYSWLRALMGEYVPFWQITQDGLDFAMEAVDLQDPELRQDLLDIYFKLGAYPETKSVLQTLKSKGIQTATLSNGSPDMLSAAVTNADLGDLLDEVISVDAVKTFKVSDSVYQYGVDQLGVPVERIAFMSSNGWDAWAAGRFGFQVIWVNRFDQPMERLPGGPKAVVSDLTEILPLVAS